MLHVMRRRVLHLRGRLLHLRRGRMLQLRRGWLVLRWRWQLLLWWLRRLWLRLRRLRLRLRLRRLRRRWRWRLGHHLRRRWRWDWGLHGWIGGLPRRRRRWCRPYKLMLRSGGHRRAPRSAARRSTRVKTYGREASPSLPRSGWPVATFTAARGRKCP